VARSHLGGVPFRPRRIDARFAGDDLPIRQGCGCLLRPPPFLQVGWWIPALQAADRSASRLAVARGHISDAAARCRARVREHGWLTRHSGTAWTYSGAGRRAADVEASTSLPGRVGSESAPAISTQKGRVNKGSAPHPPPLAVVVHDPKLTMSGPSRTPAQPSAGRSVGPRLFSGFALITAGFRQSLDQYSS
jgi:hypothetical protein